MPPGPFRLFVSVRPDAAAAANLAALLPPGLPPGAKPVPAPRIHLTLQFIGETAPSRVNDVIESIGSSVAGLRAQRLVPREVRTLPERGPARTVAVITDWPAALAEAQRRLAARLSKRPSGRRSEGFLPHLTLARCSPAWTPTVREWPVSLEPFDIREVELVRSILTAGGAIHEVVASFPLG